MALSLVGGALVKVRAQTSPSDTILHPGKNSGPSKQQGLKCGGQDVCQACGLTHLFGGSLGCVDKNRENIPVSSCSAGVEEDTEYLKCGDNCFVACQDGGSVFQIVTETFKGRGKSLSGTGCRDLCQLVEGCISFKYKQSMDKKKCTLKYNQEQAETSDTCKHAVLPPVSVRMFSLAVPLLRMRSYRPSRAQFRQ
jgi:hypothetical protein